METPNSNDSLVDIEIQTPKQSVDVVVVKIQERLGDQDFQQKTGVTITVLLELYRVLIASFLILFVPQTCGDHICSISENAQLGTDP